MTMVSGTFWWRNYTCILFPIAALPLGPLTGQYHGSSVFGKEIWYICGSPVGLGEGGDPTYLPIQRYNFSFSGPQMTPPPIPLHIPGTPPVAECRTSKLGPLLSSAACKLLTTGYQPRDSGGRASQLSYRNFSISPTFRTNRWVCRTPPAANQDHLLWPGRFSRKVSLYSKVPPSPTLPDLPCLLSPNIPIDASLPPPPCGEQNIFLVVPME